MSNFRSLNGYEVEDSKARIYPNVAAMKSISNLANGDIIKTAGYYTAGDGGSATYLIRTKTETDIEDLGSIHFINDNLVAELIVINDKVFVEQFGVVGDGETNDSLKLNSLLENDKFKKICFNSNKRYLLQNNLNITKQKFIEGNDCKLILDNCSIVINIPGDGTSSHYDYFGKIQNFHFIGNSNNPIIQVDRGYKSHIYNCYFEGFTGSGLVHIAGYENVYDLLRFDGVGVNSIGLDIRGNDIIVKNIYGKDCHTFIKCTGGGNLFNNLHAWLLDVSLFEGSIFFDNQTSQINKLDTVYFDTYETCVNCPLYSALTVSNSLVLDTSVAITPTKANVFDLHGKPYNGQRIYVNNMTCYLGETWKNVFKVNSEDNNQIQFDGLIIPSGNVEKYTATDIEMYLPETTENISLKAYQSKNGIVNVKGIAKVTVDNSNTATIWNTNASLKPIENYEGICYQSQNRYLKNIAPAFLIVANSNGAGTITFNEVVTGEYYIFVDVSYRTILTY